MLWILQAPFEYLHASWIRPLQHQPCFGFAAPFWPFKAAFLGRSGNHLITKSYLPLEARYRLGLLKAFLSPRRKVKALKINLEGDRDIEWSWVSARIPEGPGLALDFGSGGSHLGLIAAHRGFLVTAIDRESVNWRFYHPGLKFFHGDLFEAPLQEQSFDLIINCSTIEHVGLVGRYSVTQGRPDGDLEAMQLLRSLMKPGAIMLMTIPVGRDSVFPPACRVYGSTRLPKLIDGFTILEELYWTKTPDNLWTGCDSTVAINYEPQAGSFSPLETIYALGCFVLLRPS